MSSKIFIMDDDENACNLAARALANEGFEVATETKAIGATQKIKSFLPDLVLLDVMMPALSGEDLIDIIYKIVKPKPKVLFYSNKSREDLRALVEESGADGFVCKVDGPSALTSAVRLALE